MSVGPMGYVAGLTGAPLAQTRGSEVERGSHDSAGQARRAETSQQAEAAAGVGTADGEEHQAAERDADGRRLWERPLAARQASDARPPSSHQSKDATGEAGTQLDLTG